MGLLLSGTHTGALFCRLPQRPHMGFRSKRKLKAGEASERPGGEQPPVAPGLRGRQAESSWSALIHS
jgi:hypothetical protein